MGATKNDVIKMGEAESETQNPMENLTIQLNKSNALAQIDKIESAVVGGNVNPLEAHIYLKWIEDIAKKARERISDLAVTEAQKYPEKEIEVYGAKVQKRAAAGRWDYSACTKVQELKEVLKEEEKDAQRAYHCFQKGENISDADGVVIQPASYTPGKDSIAIQFK